MLNHSKLCKSLELDFISSSTSSPNSLFVHPFQEVCIVRLFAYWRCHALNNQYYMSTSNHLIMIQSWLKIITLPLKLYAFVSPLTCGHVSMVSCVFTMILVKHVSVQHFKQLKPMGMSLVQQILIINRSIAQDDFLGVWLSTNFVQTIIDKYQHLVAKTDNTDSFSADVYFLFSSDVQPAHSAAQRELQQCLSNFKFSNTLKNTCSFCQASNIIHLFPLTFSQ